MTWLIFYYYNKYLLGTKVLTHLIGDHIVSSVDLYGGTSVYMKQVADRFNIKTTFVSDITDPLNIEKAIQANTKVQ